MKIGLIGSVIVRLFVSIDGELQLTFLFQRISVRKSSRCEAANKPIV